MDPDESETASFDLASSSADLGEVTRNISGLLDQLDWQGADATAFRGSWGQFAPAVLTETEGTGDKATQLWRRAQRQRDASR
ncbi:hypothetical protein BLA60_05980 [Actinophytocola xinjiangensis]|uniref:WXG100 family type VII secretion target n=2 Tax=Actinophytocola xinjiangensis TaxID=485602 RepID=A0A7Z1B013_9PSEU|nr:hypothetical protein BLA60_05980 [Actinophytocola xinjiangensis]